MKNVARIFLSRSTSRTYGVTFGSGPLSNVKVTVTNFRPVSHEESPLRLKSVREAGDVTTRVRKHDLHRVRAPHRRLLHVLLEYLEVPELPATNVYNAPSDRLTLAVCPTVVVTQPRRQELRESSNGRSPIALQVRAHDQPGRENALLPGFPPPSRLHLSL